MQRMMEGVHSVSSGSNKGSSPNQARPGPPAKRPLEEAAWDSPNPAPKRPHLSQAQDAANLQADREPKRRLARHTSMPSRYADAIMDAPLHGREQPWEADLAAAASNAASAEVAVAAATAGYQAEAPADKCALAQVEQRPPAPEQTPPRCCFCHRPGDDKAAFGLGELRKTRGTVFDRKKANIHLYFHEPCAAYSGGMGAIPTTIMDVEDDVVREWQRGGVLSCVHCKAKKVKPSNRATIGCAQQHCRVSLHFPCARELAAEGKVFFAEGPREVVCSKHKQWYLKQKHGRRPSYEMDESLYLESKWQGMWMEGSGGWNGGTEASKTWWESFKPSWPKSVEEAYALSKQRPAPSLQVEMSSNAIPLAQEAVVGREEEEQRTPQGLLSPGSKGPRTPRPAARSLPPSPPPADNGEGRGGGGEGAAANNTAAAAEAAMPRKMDSGDDVKLAKVLLNLQGNLHDSPSPTNRSSPTPPPSRQQSTATSLAMASKQSTAPARMAGMPPSREREREAPARPRFSQQGQSTLGYRHAALCPQPEVPQKPYTLYPNTINRNPKNPKPQAEAPGKAAGPPERGTAAVAPGPTRSKPLPSRAACSKPSSRGDGGFSGVSTGRRSEPPPEEESPARPVLLTSQQTADAAQEPVLRAGADLTGGAGGKGGRGRGEGGGGRGEGRRAATDPSLPTGVPIRLQVEQQPGVKAPGVVKASHGGAQQGGASAATVFSEIRSKKAAKVLPPAGGAAPRRLEGQEHVEVIVVPQPQQQQQPLQQPQPQAQPRRRVRNGEDKAAQAREGGANAPQRPLTELEHAMHIVAEQWRKFRVTMNVPVASPKAVLGFTLSYQLADWYEQSLKIWNQRRLGAEDMVRIVTWDAMAWATGRPFAPEERAAIEVSVARFLHGFAQQRMEGISLPLDVASSPDVVAFYIENGDTRLGLHGQEGLQAMKLIPRGSVIGALKGTLMTRAEYDLWKYDAGSNLPYGMDRSWWEAMHEAHHMELSSPDVARAFSWLPDQLVLSTAHQGNILALINDPEVDPLAYLAPMDEPPVVGKPNVHPLVVSLVGFPVVLMVALVDILPGQELMHRYGRAYWERVRPSLLAAAVRNKSAARAG